MEGILRDRIVLPPGEISVPVAKAALTTFEKDVVQAKAMQQGGKCDTLIVDGGSTLMDVITIVTLDESKNPNNTYRYAGRNAYIKTLFNDLNTSGLNVVWISKAKSLWVGDKRIAGEYVPDCHDDIPFMVDVNMQMVAERKPPVGLNYYGVLGMNAFTDKVVGVRVPNMTWDLMVKLLFPPKGEAEAGEGAA